MARRMETRSLRVDLSDEQVEARSRQLAGDYLAVVKAEMELESFLAAQKDAAKARKGEVERMKGDVAAQARAVHNRYVVTAVDCDWEYVVGMGDPFKVLVRRDTLEAVEREKLSTQEAQMALGEKFEGASPDLVSKWLGELAALGLPKDDGEPDDFERSEEEHEPDGDDAI